MSRRDVLVRGAAALLFSPFASRAPRDRWAQNRLIASLGPLHGPMPHPATGDWLSEHREPGQTFTQYINRGPVDARGTRQVLYIQPIGALSQHAERLVDLCVGYMGHFFGLDVRVGRPHPVGEDWPAWAKRVHPSLGSQLRTDYILDHVLKPALPSDAAASLGLTETGLWPGRGWNFVFGYASSTERVGVISISPSDTESEGTAAARLALTRTLKIATHETGHMFSIEHCTAHPCNLNGSNSQSETDASPLALCPQCLAKVIWATAVEPKARFSALSAFCKKYGLLKEADFFRRSLEALS